jgi:putative ABC transport system ATP-binding protein
LVDASVRYGNGENVVWALRDVSLDILPGEFVSITGPSGSGKTTLLNVLAGLEPVSSGRVIVADNDLKTMRYAAIAKLRRTTIAYIFQFFNLLPTLTVVENVELPMQVASVSKREARDRALSALDAVGLGNRTDRYPEELSGGEMQRVAIARALASHSRLILADEPTGNLDSLRGEEVLGLLRGCINSSGRAVVLVTHDLRAAAYGDRMITLRDGAVVDEVKAPGPASVTKLPADSRSGA